MLDDKLEWFLVDNYNVFFSSHRTKIDAEIARQKMIFPDQWKVVQSKTLNNMTLDVALCRYKELRREYIDQSAIIRRFEDFQTYLSQCRDIQDVKALVNDFLSVARSNRKESENLACEIVKKFPMIPANSFD